VRGLVAAAAALVVCTTALAQDAGLARDAAREAWLLHGQAQRAASQAASDARAAHQACLARERERAPWWMPDVVVRGRLARARAATHEAALVVVKAEHLLVDATAGERLARLQLIRATNDLVDHLERVGAEPAAIDSHLQMLAHLGREVDLTPPEPVPAPARDRASLARLAPEQLEDLVLTFEDLARGAEERAAALEAMRRRSEVLLARMERRRAQGVAAMATPIANQRAQRDRLVAWRAREVACATDYRGHVGAFQAELDAREALRRSTASPERDG
jgi:hypothetical protein